MQKRGPTSTLTDLTGIVVNYGIKLPHCRNEVPVELFGRTSLRYTATSHAG